MSYKKLLVEEMKSGYSLPLLAKQEQVRNLIENVCDFWGGALGWKREGQGYS